MALTKESTRPPAAPQWSQNEARRYPQPMARNLSAAQIAGLPRIETVTVKDVADAANLTPETIRERLKLWIEDPSNPRAIPFFVALGKPYQIPAQWIRDNLLSFTPPAND